VTDYAAVLTALYPGAEWSLNANDPDQLVWLSEGDAPTVSELDGAWPQVQYDRAYAEVRAARHAAYAAPDGPDAIFLQWQRGDATEQDWLDAVQAVKDAHPYPPKPERATTDPISEQGDD
jgi:hypothetical protein